MKQLHNLLLLCISVCVTNLSAQEMTAYTKQVFPLNHALNTRIDLLPVHPNSDAYIASIGAGGHLHPDWGSFWDDEGTIRPIGIPYNVVPATQPLVPITFISYAEESDPGPWPIPANPYIETVSDWRNTEDGDRHMLIVNEGTQMLYECGNTYGNADGTEWTAGGGAVWDLTSNALRPETWTSSDAAGLPIFPLLIRYDEVEKAIAAGSEIPHAIRFTVVKTQRAYQWPARHYASSNTDPNLPPMGLRLRLKADFDISGFTPRMQVILRTFKKYGIIVADNGSNWYIQGTHDERWNNDELGSIKGIAGSNFEVVDISSWLNHPNFDVNSAAVPDEITSILNFQPDAEFELHSIYPNPMHTVSTLSFKIPEAGEVKTSITNLAGQQVYSTINMYNAAGTYLQEINIIQSTIPAGIYFCSITFKGEQRNIKLVVQ